MICVTFCSDISVWSDVIYLHTYYLIFLLFEDFSRNSISMICLSHITSPYVHCYDNKLLVHSIAFTFLLIVSFRCLSFFFPFLCIFSFLILIFLLIICIYFHSFLLLGGVSQVTGLMPWDLDSCSMFVHVRKQHKKKSSLW